MIEKIWSAQNITNAAFGPVGKALGVLGGAFGEAGKQFGYEGASNIPKYNPKDHFNIAGLFNISDQFDPMKLFNAQQMANRTMESALSLK